jgi:hypothetical protein
MKRFFRSVRRAAWLVAAASPLLPTLSVDAQTPMPSPAFYSTRGNPTSAVATRDGQYVFVSVTNVGQPNFSGPDSVAGGRKDAVSGIEVFARSVSKNGQSDIRSIAFVRTGSTGANGLVLLRGERTLAVGVGNEGVAFLDVHDLIRGRGVPRFAHQTEGAGTFDVVATANGE